MTLRYLFDPTWMPAAASGSTIWTLMEEEGWFLQSNAGDGFLVNNSTLVTGRFGTGQRIALDTSGAAGIAWNRAIRPINAHNSGFGYVGCSLRVEGNNGSTTGVQIGVFDAVNNAYLIVVSFEVNGVVRVYRGGGLNTGGTLLGASEANAYLTSVDYDVEIAFKVNSTTGEVQVKVNTGGVAASPSGPVIHLVNVNTQPGSNAYFDSIFFGWDRGLDRPDVHFKIGDLRYYDDQGSINNAFLGTSRVQTLLTAGAGATTDFSISGAATNWQGAQNQNVDDTKYVFDPTTGQYDLYTFQPLVNSPTVFGVQILTFVRQDDVTQRTYKNRISSGGTIADGAAYLTAQSYSGDHDIFELDPHTGIQFTGAGVNALQGGPLVFA